MSDADHRGDAWRVTPSAYLAGREAPYAVPVPASRYLAMSDGCRLAIDVYLPDGEGAGGRRWPTMLILTPYYRRFALKPGSTGSEPSPNVSRYRDMFVPRGYAVVIVDVRGSGASFGTRDSFRSPREREDCREIVDWIVAQPWSDGGVGATGISYLGAASDFLASTGHPAVKAVAPLFSVWDTYSDHYYPGGILLNRLAKVYDDLMVALDHDRRDLLPSFVYYRDPNLAGPMPVDEDADGSLCRAAIHEHLSNFRMPDFITEFRFKDDPLPYDPTFTSASFSPYAYAEHIRPEVAVYSVGGWYDGAGYCNGSLSRFLTLANPNAYVLIGPWDHGARVNVSPWRDGVAPEFPFMAEILRFFDQHLAGMETGLGRESRVHYFVMHEEAWREAESWPPASASRSLHLGAENRLGDTPAEDGSDPYRVDFSVGTGGETRYERIAAIDSQKYYCDWAGRDERMLSYTSEPLASPVELTGHAVLTAWLASSEPDAAVFAYLSEVERDGTVRYVTEGLLRLLHRQEAECPPHHKTTWPYRSFARRDARPMRPGEVERIRFALLPVGWRFEAGSRIRLSFAGADGDHTGQVPHGRPPTLTFGRGASTPSEIALPTRDA